MTDRLQTIFSAIAVIVVEVASIIGLSLDTDFVIDFLSACAFLIASVYSIWKNHNFTDAAIEGQKLVNALKNCDFNIPTFTGADGSRYMEWHIRIDDSEGDSDED